MTFMVMLDMKFCILFILVNNHMIYLTMDNNNDYYN